MNRPVATTSAIIVVPALLTWGLNSIIPTDEEKYEVNIKVIFYSYLEVSAWVEKTHFYGRDTNRTAI